MTRLTGALVASALAVSVFAAPAAAAATSMLTTIRWRDGCECIAGVFKVRPTEAHLASALGGEYKQLRWSRWGARSATGTGVSSTAHDGVETRSNVRLRLSAPRNGRFTKLTVRFSGRQPTQLRLVTDPDGANPRWAL